jgi:general secretion pathway protein D
MNEWTRCVTVVGLCWIATGLPLRADDGSEARQQAIEKAREESIRRQESIIRAEKMIRDAEQAARDKKYEDAAAAYEQVLRFLPRSPATEKLYQTAVRGVIENRLRLANSDLRTKNLTAARDNASKVLIADPSNSEAKSILARADRLAKQPEPPKEEITRPDRAPDVVAKEETVKKLLREARIWFESGHLDEAETKIRQALSIDQYNTDAMRMLKHVHEERERIDLVNRQAVSEQRMREVTQRWNPPVRRDITLPLKSGTEGTVSLKDKADTEKKLNSIILPEVKFDGARIDSVVNFLVEESRRLDPEKKGVNIVLRLGNEPAGAAPAPAPAAPVTPAAPDLLPPIPGSEPPAATPAPGPAAPSAPATGSAAFPPITLNLRDIPLFDVLKLVTDLASLKFRIERRSVVIVPASAAPETVISRVYPIQPGVFKNIVEIPEGGGGGGEKLSALGSNVKSVKREDVKKFFADAGVPFPSGTGISYNDRSSLLIVSNTPENLELFERVLQQLNVIPSQVEIEAKFIEITQQNVDELGFKWNLGSLNFGGNKNNQYRFEGGSQTYPPTLPPNTGPTGSDEITRGVRDVTSVLSANALDALLGSAAVLQPGSTELFALSGVLTDPQFQVVLRALAQKKNADLLSAPKVTTVSGNTAQIKVVREFRYPTEFTPPTATAAGSGTSAGAAVAVTPATPGGFETREVGVLLNVTPTVGPDGYTISLTLVPEVSDFDGFINYGSPGSIAAGNTIVPVNFVFNQPVFSSRQVTTTIQIWDGQTVVLGGLIREDIVKINDKVPFLGDIPLIGRLFRSKAETNVKRNLLIFVTAILVDPAGNRIHQADYGTGAPVPTPPVEPVEPKSG